MFDVDFARLFIPSGSLAEIAIRGTIVYWALFCAIRFLPRREVGGMGPSDLLVLVIIADAVQNGLGGDYESITEALFLAVIIFGWATFIDWIDYKFPKLRLAQARAVVLIRNGRMLRKAMARDNITEDELLEQLRQHGLESATAVKTAYLEGDGSLSVILRGKPSSDAKPKSRKGV